MALVVGAASFLGSHLVDELLVKDIQVIALDDLSKANKSNLSGAIKNSSFHLIIDDGREINIDFPRLDYIFIAKAQKNLQEVLRLFKEKKSRCLFISKVELYAKGEEGGQFNEYRETEEKIAKFAHLYNLNARILRLGPIFGPRMDFEAQDPIISLLKHALTSSLQKEISLEFSTRALYVDDAVNLIIKTIFAGSTAQKIFDGVNIQPVKVAEIKQVLMDPVWYESREFEFSQLPPWPTPNLEKTVKFLNWQPRTRLLSALKHTLAYFNENEIKIVLPQEPQIGEFDKKKKEELMAFKEEAPEQKKEEKKKRGLPKVSIPFQQFFTIAFLALFAYAIIWPMIGLGWGIYNLKSGLSQSYVYLAKGEFENSLAAINKAKEGAVSINSVLASADPLLKSGIFEEQFSLAPQTALMVDLFVGSAESTAKGMNYLLKAVLGVTGESGVSPKDDFALAQRELDWAAQSLSRIEAFLANDDLVQNMPDIFEDQLKTILDKSKSYSNLISKAQALSFLLPDLVATSGSKNYLILLQNNMELRPAGGFIGSFAKLNFEEGKLKKFEVNDVYSIDGQLGIHVEPPQELKEDLGQKNWYLRDSNWEPDFPTAARQAEWFYTKETGDKVEGVIALDVSAIEKILEVTGPLELSDYKEKITSGNLFEKAASYSETNFFPGSQAKKSFLTALANGLFNKMFFVPQDNWPQILSVISRSLDEKHISIYLNDAKLFSYIDSQNWTHIMPRSAKENETEDFLSMTEANMGANKANYYLDRSYKLETVIGKDGEVKHRMRINFTNRSPSDTFPAGKYKNRFKIYLPFGSKLNRALWGETEITKETRAFVDFGRSGFSMLLELSPKERKTLVLDYEVPVKVEFKDKEGVYKLNIIKQAGTLKDPFEWNITYPISYQPVWEEGEKIGPQEQTITTDLSTDRSFEIKFKK